MIREGRFTLEAMDKLPEYRVLDGDDFIGHVKRIRPYGEQAAWCATDPRGHVVGRYLDRSKAVECLSRVPE